MASDLTVVDWIIELIHLPGQISYRKMFGEYAIYCDGKVVALICNNQLYVKVTPEGRGLLGADAPLGPPYPGATPYFMMDVDGDTDQLTELIRITERSLPMPRPKPKKKR